MTEKAAQTIETGWLVAVAGRLEHQTWETDGVKRGKHRIVASRVEFLTAPRNGDGEPDVSDFSRPPQPTTSLSSLPPRPGRARDGRARPGGGRPALRLRPPRHPPRRAVQRRHPLPRRSRTGAICSTSSTTAATPRSPTAPAHASPPPRSGARRAPMTRHTDSGLYIVEVDDHCQAQLVGHSGCSYASPPQPAVQALALVRALLSCPQHDLRVGDSPWRSAIAGGTARSACTPPTPTGSCTSNPARLANAAGGCDVSREGPAWSDGRRVVVLHAADEERVTLRRVGQLYYKLVYYAGIRQECDVLSAGRRYCRPTERGTT